MGYPGVYHVSNVSVLISVYRCLIVYMFVVYYICCDIVYAWHDDDKIKMEQQILYTTNI